MTAEQLASRSQALFSSALAGLAVAVCFLVPLPAAAANATEPTQILNNMQLLLQAADGATTAEQTVAQYAKQLEQYQLELQNIAKLGSVPTSLLVDASRTLQDVQGYRAALQSLEGSLTKQARAIEQRVTEARLGGKGWSGYVKAVEADVALKQRRAVERLKNEEAILKQVGADYEFARELQAKIPNTVGNHEAIQLLNMQMNRVVTQNATVLQVMSGSLNQRADREAKKAQDAAADLAAREAYRERQQAIKDRQDRFGGWK